MGFMECRVSDIYDNHELFFSVLDRFAQMASYNELKRVSCMANEWKNRKYHVSHEPRYGDLERAFSDDELLRMWDVLEDSRADRKYYLGFRLMAARGFRPGEVFGPRGIRAENILEGGDIRLMSEKNKLLADCRLPRGLFRELCDYIGDNRIAHGPVFPGGYQHSHRIFRSAREKANLEDVYGSTRRGTGEVRLIRLTMMSFRHYAITTFYVMSGKDIKATQRFARHRSPATTFRYITVRKSEIDAVVERMSISPLRAVDWQGVVPAAGGIQMG